jgi:hypothetical protein
MEAGTLKGIWARAGAAAQGGPVFTSCQYPVDVHPYPFCTVRARRRSQGSKLPPAIQARMRKDSRKIKMKCLAMKLAGQGQAAKAIAIRWKVRALLNAFK